VTCANVLVTADNRALCELGSYRKRASHASLTVLPGVRMTAPGSMESSVCKLAQKRRSIRPGWAGGRNADEIPEVPELPQ
jgi:hypothetical protein